MDKHDRHYSTPNTALAAYLLTEGFTLLSITTSPNPKVIGGIEAVFTFQDDPHLLDCVRLWQTGQAEGNLIVFFGNYKRFLGEVKRATRRETA